MCVFILTNYSSLYRSCSLTTAENSAGEKVIRAGTKTLTRKIEAVDAVTMEQFLEFIYTGHLEGPIRSGKLKQLAVAYRMKTLEDLCDAASYEINGNQLSSLILEWQEDEEEREIKTWYKSRIFISAEILL